MTMTTDQPRRLSAARRAMAQAVADNTVRYVDTNALPWTVDGTPVGGWDGRTLREMRADGLIEIDTRSSDTGSAVTLTSRGRASLEATPDHTIES